MATEDSHVRAAEIEGQILRLESIADPATRALAMDLVASVLQLHATALDRLLRILKDQAGNKPSVFTAFDQDEIVRTVLLLHDLHPLTIRERVDNAVGRLRLERLGARAEVVSAEQAGVKVRVFCSPSCGSSTEEISSMLRAALDNAAPDANGIEIGLTGPRRDFVPLDSIQLAARPAHSA
ncbi:MAG: hypothetical protein ACRD3D_14190 [Terriglobia bacterium]